MEHTSKLGFAAPDVNLHPTVQFAFQYSAIVPLQPPLPLTTPAISSSHSDGAEGGGSVTRFALQRRLRVVTLRVRRGEGEGLLE